MAETGAIKIAFDLAEYRRAVAKIMAVGVDPNRVLSDTQRRFTARTTAYLTSQMDKALRENGDIKEGETRQVRGVEWRGWATWQVKRTRPGYGGFVVEGTRFRMRKSARGSTAAKTGRTWTASERRAQMKLSVADRPYEKVFKKRASGALHSDNSQLMRDTQRMGAGIFLVDVAWNGAVCEIRPSQSQVRYFWRQNDLRPIWVLDPDKDDSVIGRFAQEELDLVAKDITGPGGGA